MQRTFPNGFSSMKINAEFLNMTKYWYIKPYSNILAPAENNINTGILTSQLS